jgi:hypothetical protein
MCIHVLQQLEINPHFPNSYSYTGRADDNRLIEDVKVTSLFTLQRILVQHREYK